MASPKRFRISQGKTEYVLGLDKINERIVKLGNKVGTETLYDGLDSIAQPLLADWRNRVPVDEGDYKAALAISRRQTTNQEKQRRTYRTRQVRRALGVKGRQRLSIAQLKTTRETAVLFVGVAQARGKTKADHVADDPNQYAHLVEWGTSDTPAQPSGRPAWDAIKDRAIVIFGDFMKKRLGL